MALTKKQVCGSFAALGVVAITTGVALLAFSGTASGPPAFPQLSRRRPGYINHIRTEPFARAGMYAHSIEKWGVAEAEAHAPSADDEADAEFREQDKNGDGVVTFDEFVDEDASQIVSVEDQRKLFDLADTDGVPGLSKAEMEAMASNPELNNIIAQLLIDGHDEDGDGLLAPSEFSSFTLLAMAEDGDPAFEAMSQAEKDAMAAAVASFMVASLDMDADGKLGAAELVAMFAGDANE